MANKVTLKFIADVSDMSKGIQQVNGHLSGMESAMKKVGGAALAYMSFSSIVSGIEEATKAAIDDAEAMGKLANVMNNLGLGPAIDEVNAFVDTLQRASGVSEDQLRPALQTLLVATGDVADAEGLLKTAMDVSQATGKDLTSVVSALGKAYGGSNTALLKLIPGLDKATVSSNSFAQNQQLLNKLFGGASQ